MGFDVPLMSPIDVNEGEFAGIIVKDNFFNADLTSFIAKSTEELRWRYWRPVTDDLNNNKSFDP